MPAGLAQQEDENGQMEFCIHLPTFFVAGIPGSAGIPPGGGPMACRRFIVLAELL
jgi:hypothetical protein